MAGFLDKILESNVVGDILGKTQSVLGIDVGSSAIKVVQLGEKNGRAVLENYGALALGPYADLDVGQATNLSKAKLKEALSDLLREANISVKKAAMSIPMGLTLLSLVEVPKVDKKKLDSMIPIQARKLIPVPISEVMLDYWVLPERKEDQDAYLDDKASAKQLAPKLEVLIAGIHNETINKYREIKEGAGLQSYLYEIDIFSAIRAVVGRDDNLVMVVDMGAGTTKLAIVEAGILRMQHIINMGSQDISVTLSKSLSVSVTEGEKIKRELGLTGQYNGIDVANAASMPLNHIFSQLNKVLLGYRKRTGHQVKKIILSGGGALLKGLPELAGKNVEAEIVVSEPFSRIETPVFLENTLKEAGPEFAVAIGLAIKALQD
jgi:type IV pilus assembly protein PilM